MGSADSCPHEQKHEPRADDGLELVKHGAVERPEQVRHAMSGYELQQDGSCEWVDLPCSARYYTERELFDLREANDIHRLDPVRAGYLPCAECRSGDLALVLNRMAKRDLSKDREARAIFFHAEGRWPARRGRDGKPIYTALSGEQEPAADGTPIGVGPDKRFETEKAWDE